MKQELKIKLDHLTLTGELSLPENSFGLVIFSHGSGSSRFSPRNNFVAQYLNKRGLATYLFDLLTREEDENPLHRFDVGILANRLVKVTTSLMKSALTKNLPLAYFGASTGAASALIAASVLQNSIRAIVSRGGRPDLASNFLKNVKAPTLFMIGEFDQQVIVLNKQAYEKLPGPKFLRIIKGASHLFEEPGTLEEVAHYSAEWFMQHLGNKENKSSHGYIRI
ncbi:alpha/beta hydrolase family protein [Cyclobacterium jeungdonense]|uniref:Alpha/beta hydrolase n=1 Tax=Cyclobacterium jeungdonense TaxID=708087 RepID=A0ABT8CDA6_9BACT|nr:alpha/beta hydrolase [Cyclobacterium jeungdonense]MDN3690172.1 alpha/beta hydrolase [Cyclobacterium jeungdonense]